MKKISAVDWLVEQWPILESQIPPRILEQANEMFEKQIMDAYETSHISMMTSEQYYNETFKSE
jgi:hypothetical protein